jgi:RNA polymerase sigma-70 factor (ECF subfamily)
LSEARWRRLMALLAPWHERAVATARRLCRSTAEGDDLYQEAVLRAYDKLDTLRDESRFRSWFFVTLLSRHRSRARRAFWKRFLRWGDAFPDGAGPAGEDGSRWGERTLEARRMAAALGTLPPEQREAVVLFELDGFSIEEIADLQRVSPSAVKSRLGRGRERLRRHYQRLGMASAGARDSAAGEPRRNPEPRTIRDLTSIPRLLPTTVGKERSDD